MARVWLPLALALSACNVSRDQDDKARLRTLEALVAERTALKDSRAERETEHVAIREALAPFKPVSNAELVTLAGEGAQLRSEEKMDASRLISIAKPGTLSDGVAFGRALLAHSQMLNLNGLELANGTWVLSISVLEAQPLPPPAPTAPSPDSAWCYAWCPGRRQQIVDQSARLVALDAELGELVNLPREKKALEQLLNLDGVFIPDRLVLPLLERLEDAPWLQKEASIIFTIYELQFKAPAELQPDCAATFSGCEFSSRFQRLEVDISDD